MPTKTSIKLNLGSRDKVVPGFSNMDIDAHPGVEFVGDVSDLSRFESGAVSEILASNILEHFPHTETLKVLKEWARVLEPGGVLHVSVPDFERTVYLYQKCGLNDWIQNYLCGDQIYKTAFHYAIFDENRLRGLLKAAGFSDISRVESLGFSKDDCSELRSTYDGLPVALNMVALR